MRPERIVTEFKNPGAIFSLWCSYMEKEIEKYLKDQSWTEKFRRIKMSKRLYNLSRIVAISIILIAFILLMQRIMFFLKRTQIFSINNIIIKGNKVMSIDEILETGKIVNVKNIFAINLKKLEENLILHPRIRKASVKRKLPNLLYISIEERKPIALINTKKDMLFKIYEIDREGYIIGEGDRISNFDLPVITGIESDDIILGEKIKDRLVLKILESLYKINEKIYNFERLIAEINIRKIGAESELIVILNEENIPVYLGNGIIFKKFLKLNSLIMIVAERLNEIEYIDFKYNDAVIKWKQI